jgi:hypothetical protein
LANTLNAHLWETVGRFLKGQLLIERGDFAQGLLVLRDAFERCDRTGWRLSYAEFKGTLALGLAGTGRLDEALLAVDDAMAADREGADGRGWYAPELLRIKGDVLLQQAAGQLVLAADCFAQATQMAREAGRSILGAQGRSQRCPFAGESRSPRGGESVACISL